MGFSGIHQSSAADLDGLDVGLLNFLLGDSHSEDAVLHGGLDLVNLGVLRQPEPPEELAAAPLHAVPLVVLLLLLLVPLAADLKDPAFLHLHFHLLLLHPGEVGLEDVGIGRLFPVDAGVGEGGGFAREAGARLAQGAKGVEGEALEGVENVEREGIKDVAAPHDRHGWKLL